MSGGLGGNTLPEIGPILPWWGDYRLKDGQRARFRVGPQQLWVGRSGQEWSIGHRSGHDPLDNSLKVERITEAPWPDDLQDDHFGVSHPTDRFRVDAMLPDRPLVTLPAVAFTIPAGESIRIFATVPLWMRVTVGSEHPRVLYDQPVFQPSDTWFGSYTAGELCYAARTQCLSRVADLEVRPHRAVTAIAIENRAKTPLKLQRIKLPVPRLGLVYNPDGRLWTQTLRMRRTEDSDYAEIQVEDRWPAVDEPGDVLLVASARKRSNRVIRAFGALLGGFG